MPYSARRATSLSSRKALRGRQYTLIELDKDYYEAAKKRLINHQAQGTLF